MHPKREYLYNMKNKNNRLEAIRLIISEQDIKNQDQLLQILTARGYSVTQATLSRDLKKMKISKVANTYGDYLYVLPNHALLQKNPRPSNAEKAAVLAVNPYFFREYDSAISFYPLQKCLRIISLLNEYDYRGKGGDTGEATGADLLMELVTKILNL